MRLAKGRRERRLQHDVLRDDRAQHRRLRTQLPKLHGYLQSRSLRHSALCRAAQARLPERAVRSRQLIELRQARLQEATFGALLRELERAFIALARGFELTESTP